MVFCAFFFAFQGPVAASGSLPVRESAENIALERIRGEELQWRPLAQLQGPIGGSPQTDAILALAAEILSMRMGDSERAFVEINFERGQTTGVITWRGARDETRLKPEALEHNPDECWRLLQTDLVRLEELARAKRKTLARHDICPSSPQNTPEAPEQSRCMVDKTDSCRAFRQALERVTRGEIQCLCQTLEVEKITMSNPDLESRWQPAE